VTRTILNLVFLIVATAANADALTLASTYKAVGTNPDGSKYTGTVVIDILSDTTFGIQWKISGTIYKGFGMRRNDALAATYMINGQPGLIIYQVDGNGLDGLWSVRGQNGSGAEHLTPAD
jgi:hypothetical protein